MLGPVRRIIVAALLVCMVLSGGCWLWPASSKKSGSSARMTPIEARQAIEKAKNQLYRGTPEAREEALARAEAVIKASDDPDALWNAHLVKALALQALDRPGPARDSAMEGFKVLLSRPEGALDTATLSNLKILLPIYVHNAVRSSPPEEVAAQLSSWKDALDTRLALVKIDPSAVQNLRLEFDLLREMADEYYATRKPDVLALELIRGFVTYYNTKNVGDFQSLIAPETELAERVRTNGVVAVAAGRFDGLYIAGPIKLDMPPAEGESPPAAAVATCDLLAVSPGGWAEVRPAVVFELVRGPGGGWLIKNIKNL